VPLVLFLFTRAPLGIGPSLGLGVLLVATHRLYARPFALAHARGRCLWCGRMPAAGPSLAVQEPMAATEWATCGAPHAERARRFLRWTDAHRAWLRVGILGTLVLFLAAAVAIAAGRGGGLRYADAVNAFRLAIGLVVLPLGLQAGGVTASAGETLRPPFPVHIQALIGTVFVSWLFRLVGLAWIALALWHFAARA